MHLTWEKTSSFLMGVVCILLFIIFKKYLKKKKRSNFCFYVPVNESILEMRNKILQNKITYDIKMTVLDQNQFFVDMQIQFKFNKNKKIDAKYLFLDFYNFPQKFSSELNGTQFQPKILHGRIYLQKKLLNFSDFNTLSFSYLAKFPKNYYCYMNQNNQNYLIFQKSACIFSVLFPCFQMNQIQLSIFLSMKISKNLYVFHNGELIDEKVFKNFKILQYFALECTYQEFLLIIKQSQFQLNKIYCRKPFKVYAEQKHPISTKVQYQQEIIDLLNCHLKKIQVFL